MKKNLLRLTPENSLHCGLNSSPCSHRRIQYKASRMCPHGTVLCLIDVHGLGVESALGLSVPAGSNLILK